MQKEEMQCPTLTVRLYWLLLIVDDDQKSTHYASRAQATLQPYTRQCPGPESSAELECSSCATHHSAGAGGRGSDGERGVGGGGSRSGGGDGARASEGRSFVLNGLASQLLVSQSSDESSTSPCNWTCRLRVLSSLSIPRED